MAIEEIVKTLKAEIIAGKTTSEGKLPVERELQAMFNVGRGTVREALKVLEGMGLIEIRKGRGGGAFVSENATAIASESLADLFKVEEFNFRAFIDFRKMFEPKMVFSAASNRTGDDLNNLRDAIALLDGETNTLELFVSATTSFFKALAAATRNDYLIAFYHPMIRILSQTAKLMYEIPKCVETSKYFYSQLFEAVEDKDPAKGKIICHSYLVQLEDFVKNAKQYGIPIARRKKTIKWGIIQDLSSATVDYGKRSAMGLIDAARYVNENGGINGKRLELVIHDDHYRIAECEQLYEQLRDSDNVTGIYVQSTGANQRIAPKAMQDGIFMFSGAPSARLCDPVKYPYYFCIYPTYSDMIRAGVKYIRTTWINEDRNPKLVFIFPDNPYGNDPLKAGKKYAKRLEIEVGPDQIINWPTIDASEQLTAMQEFDPDFAIISSTAKNAVSIFKDAHRLGIKTKFICNIRVFNEELIRLGTSTVEGALGIQPLAFYGEKVPGMEKIIRAHDKWHPYHRPTLVYVEGWANILVLSAALKIADNAGELNAPGLKKAFEQFENFDTEGLTPLINYSKTDHRPTTETRIYKIQNHKFIPAVDSISVNRTKSFT
ncbi:MAG: ABC transporter substrate-binding protein [Desulfobacula sp.]|uniref:ABC transporter substrate-binding protein n=2 Tax=Desulfobacula sp. TaxID=2593537 RepID=UPI001D3893FF|nr:ABC transporter substrate-binding protein [Desulfobacula sp.]MBT4024274.1 ABC transporter substrate-binding protein [Desulfobacula sp.]MBT4874680.1 ABC transporter substrate-binding protein [Desulfobacula sp.]MBT5543437.1 ABC transporter substrate-binding protein [Desulfobacula sp.]MBT5973010.1 ABC transporter substrate-binding protein [Desulfobacula sp.]